MQVALLCEKNEWNKYPYQTVWALTQYIKTLTCGEEPCNISTAHAWESSLGKQCLCWLSKNSGASAMNILFYKTHNSFQALGVLKQQKLNTSFWELGLLPLLLNSDSNILFVGIYFRDKISLSSPGQPQTRDDPYSTSWTAGITGTNHHWLKLRFCYKPDESLASYSSERPKWSKRRKWTMVAKHGLLWPQSCRQRDWGFRVIKTTLYFQLKFYYKACQHQIKNNLHLTPRHRRTTLSQTLLTRQEPVFRLTPNSLVSSVHMCQYQEKSKIKNTCLKT